MNVSAGETPPEKKNRLWQILAIVALFLAVAGGLFGFLAGNPKMAAMFIPQEKVKSITLPSLTVNLADRGYAKTTITMEYISDKKLNQEIENSTYALKDCAIRVLRNTSYGDLQEPQSMENLRSALQDEINSALSAGKITKLYFEEFIIQ